MCPGWAASSSSSARGGAGEGTVALPVQLLGADQHPGLCDLCPGPPGLIGAAASVIVATTARRRHGTTIHYETSYISGILVPLCPGLSKCSWCSWLSWFPLIPHCSPGCLPLCELRDLSKAINSNNESILFYSFLLSLSGDGGTESGGSNQGDSNYILNMYMYMYITVYMCKYTYMYMYAFKYAWICMCISV